MTEPDHIARAKALLRSRESGEPESGGKPRGVTSLADIAAAESRLGAAQAELRDYQNSTDGMRETIDKSGITGVVVERHRFEKMEHLQAAIDRRERDLQTVKRNWLAGLLEG